MYGAQRLCRSAALLLTLLSLVFALHTHAQADTTQKSAPRKSRQYDESMRLSTAAIGWNFNQPLGEFADAQKHFWGAGAQVAFHVKETPFDAGVGLGYEWLEEGTSNVTVQRSNMPDTTGELEVRRRTYAILPMLRFRPIQGPFMFYAEVFGGVRFYGCRSIVTVGSSEKNIRRTSHNPSNAWEWGAAAGIMIRTPSNLFLDVRFARTWGGQATFMDYDRIQLDEKNRLGFGTLTSLTDTWQVQAGIGSYF